MRFTCRPSALLALCFMLVQCGSSPTQHARAKSFKPELSLSDSSIVTSEMSYLSNAVEGLVDKQECSERKSIKIAEPEVTGSFPVLLYFTGSWSPYASNAAMEIIKEAASQGFVAATVEYQNNTLPSFCNGASGTFKLRCIYSSSANPESAVAAVCSRPKADCDSKGIVVAGFSQGGAIAAMGRNWDERIRGAWTMGYGDANSSCDPYAAGQQLGSSSGRMLDNERIRFYRGLNESSSAEVLNQLSGRDCPRGSSSCLNGPEGSGWFRPKMVDVTASLNPNKHCFFQANGKNAIGTLKDCATPDNLDPKWTSRPPNTTYPQGVYENIRWLKQAILPLGPQYN